MTTAVGTRQTQGWLYGPVPDLLLGCGLLYGLLFAAMALFGPELRALQPGFFLPLLIVLVSMPHYGGTLVRVYEQRADRRSYAIFSVWATLLLAALFVWGSLSGLVASCLFTLYITWSPWHYTGQNYGLAVMFLRRRGVALAPVTKRLLYASFLLGFVLTFLVFHSALGMVDYNARAAARTSVIFLPLGIPAEVHRIAFPLVLAAYLATLVASAALLLRQARARDLVPTAVLVATQALWFVVPFSVAYFRVTTGVEPVDVLTNGLPVYTMWVAVGHAAQYLWVTSYYARGSRGWHGFGSYFGKVFASGVAVWTLPVIAIAPLARGRFEYETGIAMLLASVVNLHHFVLDGAIWKLRQSKIASVLIRAEPERPAGVDALGVTEHPVWRRTVWAVAAGGLAAGLYLFWVEYFVYPANAEARDYAGNAAVLDRVAWLGRDSSALRVALARNAERALDAGEAERQLRRAFELQPGAEIQAQIGHLHARAERWEQAAAAFETALALAPDDAELLKWTARAHWSAGHSERAREFLERQLVLQPDAAILHLRLADLAKQLGDEAAVTRHQREALRLEPGTRALRNDLAWTLATSHDARIRDAAEAIRLAEPLVREAETPDPNEIDTLAAAYAAAGRFDEAVQIASRAASLAAERGQRALAETIRSREQIYRTQQPYVAAAAPSGS